MSGVILFCKYLMEASKENMGKDADLKELDLPKVEYKNLANNGTIAIESLKKYQMLVIKNVPGVKELREKHFKMVPKLLDETPTDYAFTVGLKKYRDQLSQWYNVENSNQERAENILPSNIPGYQESCDQILEIKKEIFSDVTQIIDDYLTNLFGSGVDITGRVKNGGTTKVRDIYVFPQELGHNERGENAVPWHYDYVPFSVHMKDMFLDEDRKEEVKNPGAGLVIRNRDGQDFIINLDESDIMLQVGYVLQALSNGEFEAQAHRVANPANPRISRMSHISFFQVSDETVVDPVIPSTKEVNTEGLMSIPPLDRDVINPETFQGNVWHQGITAGSLEKEILLQYEISGKSKPDANLFPDLKPSYSQQRIQHSGLLERRYVYKILDSSNRVARSLGSGYLKPGVIFVFQVLATPGGNTAELTSIFNIRLEDEVKAMAAISGVMYNMGEGVSWSVEDIPANRPNSRNIVVNVNVNVEIGESRQVGELSRDLIEALIQDTNIAMN